VYRRRLYILFVSFDRRPEGPAVQLLLVQLVALPVIRRRNSAVKQVCCIYYLQRQSIVVSQQLENFPCKGHNGSSPGTQPNPSTGTHSQSVTILAKGRICNSSPSRCSILTRSDSDTHSYELKVACVNEWAGRGSSESAINIESLKLSAQVALPRRSADTTRSPCRCGSVVTA
jgi:hypothetical protein